jgi:hypothetical protein
LLLGPAAAHASTVEVASSADPAEGLPVQLTVSGTADRASVLYLAYHQGVAGCAETFGDEAPNGQSHRHLIAANVDSGYSETVAWVPPDAGEYRLCAYLNENPYFYAAPVASSTASKQARRPAGEMTISVSADPTQDRPSTVTVAGQSEVAADLYVAWHSGSTACAPTAGAEAGDGHSDRRLVWDVGRVTGSYEKTATWSPMRAGSYTICGYLNDDPAWRSIPVTSASRAIDVRAPLTTLALTTTGNVTPTDPLAVTAAGTIEGAQRFLYTAGDSGARTCGPTPLQFAGQRISWPDLNRFSGRISGSFSRTDSWVPPPFARYRVCGFVADQPYDSAPYATVFVDGIGCCRPQRPTVKDETISFGETPELIYDAAPQTAATVSVYEDDTLVASVRDGSSLPSSFPTMTERSAALDEPLKPGTYNWRVVREGGDWGPSEPSADARLTVRTPDLRRLDLSTTVSGDRRRTARFTVVATPYASVELSVRRGAKRLLRRRYQQGHVSGDSRPVKRSFSFTRSCRRPGRYTARLRATDARGHSRSRTATWRVHSCAQIRAWERAAEREAAREDALEKRKKQSCARQGGVWQDGRCVSFGGVVIIIVLF